MSITANWEKKEGNEGTLTVEVSADKFDEALDSAFKKVVKTVSLPGFRKGRIPRPIFEKRFGVESLYQDAIDLILPEAYEAAVTETGIFPVDQPAIDIEEIEKGKGFTFTADVTVKPDVKLGQYEGIEVEEEDITVTDEEVEEAINQLREGQAELVLKEEGTVEEGDTVVIDFEGFLGDEPFEGGKAENHSLEIGSGQFIPGFEEQLIGKESGVETDVIVTFPEEYQAANLAGQEATFKVKIHEIKTKELPELDDEFAKDVDEEVETLEELRKIKKQDLENGKKHEAENKKREYVIEQVTNNAEVDIPDAMVDSEVQQMLREFEQNLQMQGMTLENYTEFSGQSEDELKEQMKKDADTRVKTSLTLEAITKDANIEVTDEDVSAELDKLAEMYKMEKEQIVGMLGGSDAVLKDDLIIKKAVDYIVEKSVTK